MRLTIINQFYTPDISPTAHLSASLAEHRAEHGDRVTVVASRGGYVAPDAGSAEAAAAAATPENPHVYRCWTPQLGKATILRRCVDYLSFYVLALWRMIRLPPQDVIITLTTPPFIALVAVAHRAFHPNAKLILWNMDCYPEAAERADKLTPGGIASRVMRWINRAIFKRLSHLVTLDTAMEELLLSQYGPDDHPLPATVIPNWEKATFFPADASHERWTAIDDLGLTDHFVVLYLGNMGYGHRFDTVLEAAGRLKDEPVRFLFIGGGARFDHVKAAVDDAGLEHVILHPYVPKDVTPSVMSTVDAALITLRDESLGVMSPSKLHANLAMGLPVVYVGPKKSNVDDAIQRFDCGVSLSHGEVDRMVEFIRGMMQDKTRHADLRARARQAFDEAYNDRRTLAQFDRVLRDVMI